MSSNHKLPGAVADKHDQPYFAYEEGDRCVIKLNGDNKSGVIAFERGELAIGFETEDPIIPKSMYGVMFTISFHYAKGECCQCDWGCETTHLRGVIVEVRSLDACGLHLFDGTIRH